MVLSGRFGLHFIREAAQRNKLLRMTAEFMDMAAGPDGASGTIIITVVNRVDNKPVHGINILMEVNGTEASKQRTDSFGQVNYHFKLEQSGDYNFVAYATGEHQVGSLISTPSVSRVLGVRMITVNATDLSDNSPMAVPVAISSNITTVQSRYTVAGTNPTPQPNTGKVLNGTYNTPVVIYVPTELAGNETVTVSAPDEDQNEKHGLVGQQDTLIYNLTSDITHNFGYLPFVTITIGQVTGAFANITGDAMGRFAQVTQRTYRIMYGYSVTLVAATADGMYQVIGWQIDDTSTKNTTVTLMPTDDVDASIIVVRSGVISDLSTFEAGTDGWVATQAMGSDVVETVQDNTLVVAAQSNGFLFGVFKIYDVPPVTFVPTMHIEFDYTTKGVSPSVFLYIVHHGNVSYNEDGTPNMIHTQEKLAAAGHFDADVPISGHEGGPLTVFIAVRDEPQALQTELLLNNILVSYANPPLPAPPIPVSLPPPGAMPPTPAQQIGE